MELSPSLSLAHSTDICLLVIIHSLYCTLLGFSPELAKEIGSNWQSLVYLNISDNFQIFVSVGFKTILMTEVKFSSIQLDFIVKRSIILEINTNVSNHMDFIK